MGHDKKEGRSAAAAGIAGALIGAGITVAAIALSDKKNREKVAAKLNDAKKYASDMMDKTNKKVDEAASEIEKEIKEEKKIYTESKNGQ